MKPRFLSLLITVTLFFVVTSSPSCAMSELKSLTQEEANKAGITLKTKPDGRAGTKVWLEIKNDGPFGDFNFIELRMDDKNGQHLLSNRLQPHPVTHGQSKDITTVCFSVNPSQLNFCSLWIFKGGGLLGGEILTIKVSDFLEN